MNEFVLLSGNPFVYLTMLNFLMHHPDSNATSAERPFTVSPPLLAPYPEVCSAPRVYLNNSEVDEPLLGNYEVIPKLRLTSNSRAFFLPRPSQCASME